MSARKPKQSTIPISSFFAAAAPTTAPKPVVAAGVATRLTHSDPVVQAFYDSLSPSEIVAHGLAVDKLGTSYDVTRTHGFIRWNKARAESAK
jgi:hypothetical protein